MSAGTLATQIACSVPYQAGESFLWPGIRDWPDNLDTALNRHATLSSQAPRQQQPNAFKMSLVKPGWSLFADYTL